MFIKPIPHQSVPGIYKTHCAPLSSCLVLLCLVNLSSCGRVCSAPLSLCEKQPIISTAASTSEWCPSSLPDSISIHRWYTGCWTNFDGFILHCSCTWRTPLTTAALPCRSHPAAVLPWSVLSYLCFTLLFCPTLCCFHEESKQSKWY